MIRLAPVLFAAVLVAACGAEVAGTAATAGNLQSEQARQAQAQKKQIEADLGQALKAGEARASAAAE